MNKGLLMFTNFLVYYFYKERVPVQSQIVKDISRAAAHYSENVTSTSADHHEFTSQTRMHSSRMRTVRSSGRVGVSARGVSASLHAGIHTPPWTEWLTDRCKNITFAQLRLWKGKIAQSETNLHTINFFGSKRFNKIQCLRHMIIFHSMQSINYIG